MNEQQMISRVAKLEDAIENQDFTLNRLLLMAGEWFGLKAALGDTSETPFALLWRLRKI
tara:strand:- start:659 stop:835 length:177 start_codon:yes stop_codon:yes gene_type:complete